MQVIRPQNPRQHSEISTGSHAFTRTSCFFLTKPKGRRTSYARQSHGDFGK